MTFKRSTSTEILCALGVRLREQRLAQSLTQRELAKMAGLSLGALRKVESDGQCSLETRVRVLQALGLLEALASGLELSPLHVKLRADAYGNFPTHLHRLPGLIADSLPDGWGLLLMDRLFRQQSLRHPGPLDRLAFMGERAMGA